MEQVCMYVVKSKPKAVGANPGRALCLHTSCSQLIEVKDPDTCSVWHFMVYDEDPNLSQCVNHMHQTSMMMMR